MRVSLFIPCLVDQFYPEVGFSTSRLLRDLDLDVVYPKDQTCCGQPAYNAGHWKAAVPSAEHFLKVFRHSEYIVSPSGSCVSMVRNLYRTLPLCEESLKILDSLEDRVYELTEFLVHVLKITSVGAVFRHRVTYHDSCHLLRGLGVGKEPREVIKSVEGIDFVEMNGVEECCGFGGVFSMKHRNLALEIAASKILKASETGAEFVVACDAGCIQHMETAARKTGGKIKPIHIASILRSGGVL